MTITISWRSMFWFATGALMSAFVAGLLVTALSAEAAPGDIDTTTVPITPCRLVDTRPDEQVGPRNTPLGADETYTVDVQNASTECAGLLPTSATGLVLNVTAAQTSTLTFLTIWDTGPWPGTASLNPTPGPPVPNAVTTKLSGSNTFEIYNFVGSTHVVIDVVGYLTDDSLIQLADLQGEVATLQAQVAALEEKTASMSVVDGGATVRFSGVDLQIVDGSGDTEGTVNGTGNLVIGYNEDVGMVADRTGSHNLVVGTDNDYTSYGGVVAGEGNTIGDEYATVTGGRNNTATGTHSSVSGGSFHDSTGPDDWRAGALFEDF